MQKLRCKVCGLVAAHRPRADDPSKPRSSCVDCAKAYAKRWRRERWQRRKAYDTWKGMVARCHDPGHGAHYFPGSGVPSYRDYGARGIRVCKRWRESFEAFLADVGPPPAPDSTLDRIRCSRGYTPSNVRWVDMATQHRNRVNVRLVSAACPESGEVLTLSVSEWSRKTGVSRRTITKRLDRGWEPERAVYTVTAWSQLMTAADELAEAPF